MTFVPYGPVREVNVITNRETGRSRGFALVTFDSREGTETAAQLNGRDMGGRHSVVNIARPR